MKSDPLLLTPDEHAVLDITRMLAQAMAVVVAGDSPLTRADWAEFSGHLHAIQHMVMAQAAGRAYPDRYRLFGEDGHSGTARPRVAGKRDGCHGACSNCQRQAGPCNWVEER